MSSGEREKRVLEGVHCVLKFAREKLIAVGRYFNWKAAQFLILIHKYTRCLLGRHAFIASDKHNAFGASVHYDPNGVVVVACVCSFTIKSIVMRCHRASGIASQCKRPGGLVFFSCFACTLRTWIRT